MASKLTSTVFDVALLFEGGSMRAAYSSAVAYTLLEEGIYFDNVYGVSAGSSNTVNYLSRDLWRTKASFTDFIGDPRVGSARTFLKHEGFLAAHYIYQEAGLPDADLPFDMETFLANPAHCTVASFDRSTGSDLYFTEKDMYDLDHLMRCVRASSTLPLFMPPVAVHGHTCYDGGFATGGGLPIEKMRADGHERILVVRTRPRGYRKPKGNTAWLNAFFSRWPLMREAAVNRSREYNRTCDLLDEWEREGSAYVFYCDDLTLSGMERDVRLLTENFDAGYAQARRDLPRMKAFLGI